MYTPLSISAFMSSAVVQYLFTGFFFFEIKLTYNEMCNCWVYMSFDKWLSLCSSNSFKDSEHKHHLRKFSCQVSLCSYPPEATTLSSHFLLWIDFVSSWTSCMWNLTVRTLLYKTLSFRITSLRFTHAVGGVHNPFFFFWWV